MTLMSGWTGARGAGEDVVADALAAENERELRVWSADAGRVLSIIDSHRSCGQARPGCAGDHLPARFSRYIVDLNIASGWGKL